MVFPVGKVGDEILTHCHRQILAGVGIKTSPVAQGFKIGQLDGNTCKWNLIGCRLHLKSGLARLRSAYELLRFGESLVLVVILKKPPFSNRDRARVC